VIGFLIGIILAKIIIWSYRRLERKIIDSRIKSNKAKLQDSLDEDSLIEFIFKNVGINCRGIVVADFLVKEFINLVEKSDKYRQKIHELTGKYPDPEDLLRS
jgi:hypothetical protein